MDAIRVNYVPSNTSVDQVQVNSNNGKFIENGYLHILLNGVKYNAEGKVIR